MTPLRYKVLAMQNIFLMNFWWKVFLPGRLHGLIDHASFEVHEVLSRRPGPRASPPLGHIHHCMVIANVVGRGYLALAVITNGFWSIGKRN